jgi:Fur family ferric uptake transcriptional regulator
MDYDRISVKSDHMVACIDPGDGQNRYELLGVHGPHIHLVCQSCGAVVGVGQDKAQPLAERLLADYGFVADLEHLTLPGLCCECAGKTAESA